MKKVYLWLMLLMMCISGFAQSPTTITIGTGTSTSYTLPFNNFYKNSWSQMIYPASEINEAGTIQSIAFHVAATPGTGYPFSTLTIYMGTSSDSVNTATDSWLSMSDLTEVYSAIDFASPADTGWQTFDLDTPFPYDGSEHLVIVVSKTMASYSSTLKYTYTTGATNCCMYRQNDSDASYAQHPGTNAGTRSANRPNLQLTISPSTDFCRSVKNLTASNNNTNSVTISFESDPSQTSWELTYHPVDDTDNVSTIPLPGNTYTVTGLTPNTLYKFYVSANCSNGMSSVAKSITAATLPTAPASLPYSCDFENANENANWAFYNGTAANQWMIGSATDFGGTNSMYITNDGEHNAYYYDSASVVYAVRDIYFDPSYDYYTIYFHYKSLGLQASDYFRLYIGRTPEFVEANTTGTLTAPSNSVYLTINSNGYLGQTPDWRTVNLTLDTTWRGNTVRLYFVWVNDSEDGLNPPVAIDKIHVTGHTCVKPSVTDIDTDTPNEITVTWSGAAGASSYDVALMPYYGGDPEAAAVNVTDTSRTFTNVAANTYHSFWIRSVCGTEKSGWASYNAGVQCAIINTLPYEESFDSYGTGTGVHPTCWIDTTNNTTAYPYVNSTYRSSGIGSLYFYSTTGYYCYGIMPQIDENALTISNLMLSFKGYIANTASTYGRLDVGVMTDPTDFTTFTLVKSFSHDDFTPIDTWHDFDIYFNNYTGTGTYIAFRVLNEGTNAVYIDDVVLNDIPSCSKPTDLQISNLTYNGFTVSWSTFNTANAYEVAVVTPSGTDLETVTPITVTDETMALTDLEAETSYQVFVRGVCGSEATEWAGPVNARTLCAPTSDIPYTADFEGFGTGSGIFPDCWIHGYCGSSATYPYISSTNSHSGSGALYFYSTSSITTLTTAQALDLTYNTDILQMSFYALKTSSTYGRMDVGYMTDPSDMNTFVLLKHIYPNDLPAINTWYELSVLLPEDVNGQIIYPTFYCPTTIGGASNYLYMDDVTIDVAPEVPSICPTPTDLRVSNVNGTSALLTWTAASSEEVDYTVEYSLADQENYTTEIASSNMFMLSGLSELTQYDVRVYSNCGDSTSDTLSVSFKTSCLSGGDKIVAPENVADHQFPINTFYNHSYTQQLFTANEIGSEGNIHSIGFQYFYNTAQTKTNFSIYLAETDLTALDAWVPTDSLHLVFSDTVNFINTNPDYWVEISLDSIFHYSGNRNLLVAVLNNHGSYTTSSNNTFYTHNATGMSRYYNVDGTTPITPLPSSAGTAGTKRSNIKFGMECDSSAICIAPNLYVESVTESGITVAWVAGNNESSWEVEYKASSDTSWTSEGTISASPHTIDNLLGGVTYMVRLRSDCGNETSNWATVSATIPCVITVPYDESFENTTGSGAAHMIPCWTRGTNSTTLYPYTSSSYASTGNFSLYFYGSSTTYCYAATPRFDDDVVMDSLEIRFNLYYSTATHGIEVGIMTDPNDYSTFELLQTLTVGAASEWVMKELTTTGYTGNGRYIAFRIPQWYTDYMYLDDFHVGYITSCVRVSDITAQNITSNSATVSWTPGADEPAWEYAYGLTGTVDPDNAETFQTETNTIELTELLDNTTYDIYVRSSCENDMTSAWMMTSFTTRCLPLNSIPYSMNFDNYTHTTNTTSGESNIPNCWDTYNTGTTYTSYPYVYYGSSYAHSGNYSLRFYSYTTGTYGDQYAFLPEIDVNTINLNDLLLEFYMRAYDATYTFKVVVGITEGMNLNTFEPIDTLTSSSTSYALKSIYLSDYEGTGNRIVLKLPKPTSGYNYGNIDDISLASGACPRPQDLTITGHDASSITLEWEEMGDATNWVIEYGIPGFDLGTGDQIQVSTNPYTVTDLETGRQYEFYIYADCGGDVSPWVLNSATGATDMIAVDLPYATNFEEGSDLSWMTVNNGAVNKWRIGAHGGTNSQLFLSNSNTAVSYTITSAASSYATKLFNMGTEDSVCVSFDITCGGESSYDYIKVLLIPTNVEIPVGTMSVRTLAGHLGNYQSNLYAMNFSGYPSTGSSSTYNYIYNLTSGTVHVNGKLLNPAPGQEAYLVFFWNNDASGGNSIGATIDNISVRADSSSAHACTRPSVLTASNITTNSAELSWSSTASSLTLYYRLVGTTTYTAVQNVTSPYTLTSLDPSSNYEWYVSGVCSDGEELQSIVSEFATLCDFITIPYTMNFDGMGSGNSAFPNCWTRSNTYSTTSAYPYINTTSYSGSGSLYFYCGTTSYNLAALPPVDVTANAINTLQVSFMMRSSTLSIVTEIGVMTDPNDVSTFVPVGTLTNSATNTFEYMELPLNTYTGIGEYIAVRVSSASGNVYIDNFMVEEIPTCPRPTALTATTSTQNSVSLTWTAGGSETSWEIAYGPAGFDPEGSSSTVVTASSNPFTVQNLDASTLYDFYVRAVCSSSEHSPWSLPTSASTECAPHSLPYSENFDSYANGISTGTSYPTGYPNGDLPLCWTFLNRSTSTSTYPMAFLSSSSSYAVSGNCLFLKSSLSTPLYAILPEFTEDIHNLTLHFTYRNESTTASNGTLSVGYMTNITDANTFIALDTFPQITTLTTDSVVFSNVPSTVSNAFIVFKYTGGSANNYYLSIDDVSVTSNGSGPVITDPTVTTTAATGMTQNTATLNGTITNPDNVTITAKGFEWKVTSGGTYQPVNVTGNTLTYNLTGLAPATSYTYKAFITYNGTTVYGDEVSFTTLPQGVDPCDVPTGLHATNVQNESIDIAWDAVSSATGYNIQYRVQGQSAFSSATANTNSYTINGLTGNTNYEIQVQANCGNGNLSDWSPFITVLTHNDGIESHLENSVVLFPNPAREYIDVRIDGNVNVSMMEVYDVYGKLISNVNVVENPTRINVSSLASGMYFVRVTTEAGTITKSFVKK